ncbi:hypothetical protein [Arcticibacter sp.]|uniref:hypothetical protein n=1 Tax=Arcticibacter sp. TaxID=1872630 RepID=UPI00388E3D40
MNTEEPTKLVMEHLCSNLPNLTFIRGGPDYIPDLEVIEVWPSQRMVMGLDKLYFGFLRIRIYQTYMQPLQEIAEAIDRVMDCAVLDQYNFIKSGLLKFDQSGTVKIGILTYEYKFNQPIK